MKKIIYFLFGAILLQACGPSQKVTNSWVVPGRDPEKKYNTIFIAALVQSQVTKNIIETDLANVITAHGKKAIKSGDVLPLTFSSLNNDTKTLILKKIQDMGVDGIFTAALVDKQSETRYVSNNYGYSPYSGYGGTFWGYYSYAYPMYYSSGYYTTDKTYFIEAGLFDAQSEKQIWSVQTEAYNPTNISKFSKGFAEILWGRAENDLGRKH